MKVSFLLLLCLLMKLFSFGSTCRVVSGSSNYCDYYNCYFYSNTKGQVGETLTYCTTYYSYASYRSIYIYYTGDINIELNLGSSISGLYFYLNSASNVIINSTKVHSYLTYLSFSQNTYHFNQAYFFSYFPNLVHFSSSAYLDFTYSQTFTKLSQLTYFYVNPPSGSLNWKFEIVHDAFRGLSRLKYIELIRGDLLDVRDAFKGLISLSHLGLEGNNIAKLEPNMFKDLHMLTSLDLDGNYIKEVSNEAFVGLSALKSLSISGNPSFPLNGLSRLTGVTSLQINYNSYRTLPADPFEQMQSLLYIYADNPFFCDCSLRWTSVVSQYNLNLQSAYCLEPSKVYRTSIKTASLYTNCTIDRSYGCFSKSVSCPSEFVCRDTATSYACTCADGYSLLSTGVCVDENECQLGQASCAQHCNNTVGSFNCYCSAGYQLTADDFSCEDIDECQMGTTQCNHSETCVNTEGSYACLETGCVRSCDDPVNHSCICCNGYQLNDDNNQCVDIDECQESTDSCDMNCRNTKGSYQCSCQQGYQLVNQSKCLDVDECLTNNGDCGNTICINTVGGSHCLNLNISNIESYECNELGYSKACSESSTKSCKCCSGYRKIDSQCLDIDECKESTNLCHDICINTKGSYQCSCKTGFQLVNHSKCIDIDECLNSNGACEDICINTVGSYHCLNFELYECNALGYTKSCSDPSNKTCNCCNGFTKQNTQCVDINECQTSQHKCEMICQNTKGSYQCLCTQGFQLVNQTKCLDIDECLKVNGGCPWTCINTNGSFICLDAIITGNHVLQLNDKSNGQSASIVAVVLLVILIITIVIVSTGIIVILLIMIKRNKFRSVFQPIPNQRENAYKLPARGSDEGANLFEKVNTNDDGISENSVEIYPAPINDNSS